VTGTVCSTAVASGTPTCVVPPTTPGAACSPQGGCGGGLFCDRNGTCQHGAATGAPCDPTLGSISCDDERDLCDPTTSLCTPPTVVGGACNPSAASSCVGYATCDSSTSICEAKIKAGQPCSTTTGASCLDGLTCDPTLQLCVTQNPPGPSCS
jgi:hypothetical protein